MDTGVAVRTRCGPCIGALYYRQRGAVAQGWCHAETLLVFSEEILLFRVGFCYGRFALGAPWVRVPKAGNSGETFTGLHQRAEVYCPPARVVRSRCAVELSAGQTI